MGVEDLALDPTFFKNEPPFNLKYKLHTIGLSNKRRRRWLGKFGGRLGGKEARGSILPNPRYFGKMFNQVPTRMPHGMP